MAYKHSLYHQLIHAKGSDYQRYLIPYLHSWVRENLSDAKAVIDVGCGSGLLPQVLDAQNFQGRYKGIDTQESIQFVKEQNFERDYIFYEYRTCKFRESYDWAFASLSFSEMDDDSVMEYVKRVKTDKFVVIQASQWLFQYPAKAVKTIWNKSSFSVGKKPHWKLVVDLPSQKQKSYLHKVMGYNDVEAHIYYRPQAHLILMFNKQGYHMTSYKEIGPDQANIEESILPKFEIFEFQKDD